MAAEILQTHTPALLATAIERAADVLRSGGVIGAPTETVYGLAANAFDPEAVARIYALKGRPAHNPIIVHVASAEMARACTSRWPAMADALGSAFWPGPLTLVMPRSNRVPDIVTAGGPTVGIRWPQHPFMQGVIRACGFPLAAPSANLANRLSPTNAAHVVAQLGGSLPLIVDGGNCNVGIESTVVDVTGTFPLILRPGMITETALHAAVAAGKPEPGSGQAAPRDGILRSPGQLDRHYLPQARLVVRSWQDETGLERLMESEGIDPDRSCIIAHTRIPMGGRFPHVMLIPDDAEAFARALYAELHRCDEMGVACIVVESLPETPVWAGIRDRLRRASTR
ncbi:MAG: threonylcarbamoyl-AMP synthase [Verrucomicrobia bacterium]|nr:threonylcarbamoyl-AMP synthase [Verrucomicrobiota bacterium]